MSPILVAQNDLLAVNGSGFDWNEQVGVDFNGIKGIINASTDNNGTFSATFSNPLTGPSAECNTSVVATGLTSSLSANATVGLDFDKDGVLDCRDNCPTVYNPDQNDTDSCMVSYWTFDDGTAKDSIGSNNGIIHGASPTSGEVGQALDFDGSSNYVGVPESENLNPVTEETIEAWIYTRAANTTQVITDRPYGTRFGIFAGNNLYYTAGGQNATAPPNSLPIGQWVHVAMTVSATRGAIYVNGNEVTSIGKGPYKPISSIQYPFRIGGAYEGAGRLVSPFNGMIDEVAIYNCSLTAREIQQHYQSGLVGHGYIHGGDGIGNACDNCLNTYNPDQNDTFGVNCSERRNDPFYANQSAYGKPWIRDPQCGDACEVRECACNSCSDCNDKLNDPLCGIVLLTQNITSPSDSCINNPDNFTGKTFDCQGNTMQGPGNFTGIYLYGKGNNIIRNCVITGFNNGIYLNTGANTNTITNNTVSSNGLFGLYLSISYNNIITSNAVNNNSKGGISFGNSECNTVANNTISSNSYGILISSYSQVNQIVNNTIRENGQYGLYVDVSSVNNKFISNNLCTNKGNYDIYNLGTNNFSENYCGAERKYTGGMASSCDNPCG